MEIVQSLTGLLALSGLAWLFGERRRINAWKTVAVGLAAQLIVAAILLDIQFARQVFSWLNAAVLALQDATRAGTSFVFGYLGGGALPFTESYPGAAFVLAFQALPLILVTSALTALLYHLRILPLVVRAFAWALQRTLGVSGTVGVSAAANIFVGMVEAPLFVRPYLSGLSRSELFMVMTCGMATIAGTVFALYATFLAGVIDNAAGHLLTASLISVPAAIMVARLMVPGECADSAISNVDLPPSSDRSTMDAITRGTIEGVGLLLNVTAMLIVLVALVSLFDMVIGLLPEVAGMPLSLERILGWVMAPVVWLMGVPWDEAPTAGSLMGTKVVLNELLAYLKMAALPDGALSPRSRLIMTYAICGFANFGSLGIMLGGLCAMMPERREEIVGLGMKSIVSGTLATCLTGAVVGILG
ncbi:MAG: nucleoside transporter C-terminal domain-containing protein [Rhodospirillales bacterium]